MTYLFYFLIIFIIWIIMEIYRKRVKKPYSYEYLMRKSNIPDVQDVDKGSLKIWSLCLILFFALIIGSIWIYNVYSEPSAQEMQIDRNHRKVIGY